MKTYRCEEMMCGHCVSRMEAALTEAAIEHQISLEEKTVTIEGGELFEKQAEEILDDLGFTPKPV